MRPAVLITTVDRPDELRRCLESVLAQTRLPSEVLVVDATEGAPDVPLRTDLEARGVRVTSIPAERGRTRQLNIGVAAVTGDPVLVVDDDVVLDPGYLEAIVRAFERGGEDVAVVLGTMEGDVLRSWPVRAFRAVFLQSRHTRSSRGRVLRSGYYTVAVRPERAVEAEAVRLTATAFRRDVLRAFPLDEDLTGYALKEDVDLTYRIGRRHRILVVPDARFRHLKTPTARIAVRAKAEMHVVNHAWFFAKHLEGSLVNRAAYRWAVVGRLLTQVARSVAKRDLAYVRGTLDGYRAVRRRRASGVARRSDAEPAGRPS